MQINVVVEITIIDTSEVFQEKGRHRGGINIETNRTFILDDLTKEQAEKIAKVCQEIAEERG